MVNEKSSMISKNSVEETSDSSVRSLPNFMVWCPKSPVYKCIFIDNQSVVIIPYSSYYFKMTYYYS